MIVTYVQGTEAVVSVAVHSFLFAFEDGGGARGKEKQGLMWIE